MIIVQIICQYLANSFIYVVEFTPYISKLLKNLGNITSMSYID